MESTYEKRVYKIIRNGGQGNTKLVTSHELQHLESSSEMMQNLNAKFRNLRMNKLLAVFEGRIHADVMHAHVITKCASTTFRAETLGKNNSILPPLCLSIAIPGLLSGKLSMPREFVSRETRIGDGQNTTIFRQVKKRKAKVSEGHC